MSGGVSHNFKSLGRPRMLQKLMKRKWIECFKSLPEETRFNFGNISDLLRSWWLGRTEKAGKFNKVEEMAYIA